MKFRTFMALYALVSVVFGIGFTLAPAQLLSIYGIPADVSLSYVGRLFGAALISLAVLAWSIKAADASDVRDVVLLALFVGESIGFVVAVIGQLNGVLNVLGWSVVIVYSLLSTGLAYFRLAHPAT